MPVNVRFYKGNEDLLETNSRPVIGITSDMDDDFFKLRHGYVSAVENAGGLPLIIPSFSPMSRGNVNESISQLAHIIDGILISGGSDLLTGYYGEDVSVPVECLKFAKKERTDFELTLLREVMKREKPILAICYGMQLVNAALGGTLFQDIQTQVPRSLDHRTGHHRIKIIDASAIMIPFSDFTVNSSHHQAIKEVADGLDVFAVSEDGIVEGFIKRDYNFFLGVQWHPERGFLYSGDGPELNNYYQLSADIFRTFVKKAEARRRI